MTDPVPFGHIPCPGCGDATPVPNPFDDPKVTDYSVTLISFCESAGKWYPLMYERRSFGFAEVFVGELFDKPADLDLTDPKNYE
jgi:hypothetical protein